MNIKKLSFEDWWPLGDSAEIEVPAIVQHAYSMRGGWRGIAELAWNAALAQQAQPLTDEMIEAELNKRFEPEEHTARRWTRFGMKNARDLMGQRAQPERELKRHSCALHNTSLPCVRCGDNP